VFTPALILFAIVTFRKEQARNRRVSIDFFDSKVNESFVELTYLFVLWWLIIPAGT
jgi:hypothetical protein